MNRRIADPYRVRLTGYTFVANTNVVTASGQIDTCARA
jgi:hypothetical protein